MILRRFMDSVRRRDWFAVVVDIVIVVLGIFIGLQASQWAQSQEENRIERGYLERLLDDSSANIATLERAVALNERRAAMFASIADALEGKGPAPSPAELSELMCRWFVQPGVGLRRGTCAELVSSGRLALLRDDELRRLIALEQTTSDEASRLDILAPAVFQAAAPLNDYRAWRITGSGSRGVDCAFDFAGMRSDPRIPSVVAQLYRDQTTHRMFRQRELDAVRATHGALVDLVGRTRR